MRKYIAIGLAVLMTGCASQKVSEKNILPAGPSYRNAVMNMQNAGTVMKKAGLEHPEMLTVETLTMPGKYGDVRDSYLTITKCKRKKFKEKNGVIEAHGYRFTSYGKSRLMNDARKLAKSKKLNDKKIRRWIDNYRGVRATSLFVGKRVTLKMTKYSSAEDSEKWFQYLSSQIKASIQGYTKITQTSVETKSGYLYMCHVGDMIMTVSGPDGEKAAKALGYK